jgi:uncharacterized membrane protein YjfL (UPF0719 family)
MLISLALLGRGALGATYDTIDLVLHQGLSAAALLTVALQSALHIFLALTLGAALLASAIWIFNRLTPGVDEVAEVRNGNVAVAVVLAAILVSFAMLASGGLDAILAGLIPFPTLPSKTGVAP